MSCSPWLAHVPATWAPVRRQDDASLKASAKVSAKRSTRCPASKGIGHAVAAILAFFLSVTVGPAAAADRIAVRLDWTPWGSHAAIHLAAQKGLFAKHGLDVVIEDGNGSVATVQIVGNGEYDVGHASLAPMAIARSKGLPARAIAGFIRQNDIGLLVPRESGIKSPADLKGKKIAFTAGSLETPFIDRFLAAGKLTRNDVELLNVDAAAKAGTYMAGRTDAAFSSVPFFLAVVATQRPSNSVNFADYGLQFPSFGLFATEKTIAAKADAMRRFVSVVAGAWTYIIADHTDDGVRAVIAARPQSKLDPAALRQQIESLKGFAFTEATKSLPFGTMAASDWKSAVAVLSEGGLLPASTDPASMFTNEFIDARIVAEIGGGSH
jgi:NitT/TauT family transport system substrate-binding protein